MPPTPASFDELVVLLNVRALDFISQPRREQTARRWVSPSVAGTFQTDDEYQDFLEDVEDFVDDFLLSQPSSSGSTAFDRMSRGFKGNVQEARALLALRDARFFVIRLDDGTEEDIAACTDCLGGEKLRIYAPMLAGQTSGLTLFGRLAQDNTNLYFPAGLLTPLDDAALDVATGPARPSRFSRERESRWVEAVYMHIVRNGTLEVPGLNIPPDDEGASDDMLDADAGPLV